MARKIWPKEIKLQRFAKRKFKHDKSTHDKINIKKLNKNTFYKEIT